MATAPARWIISEIENGITKKDSFWKSIGNSIKGATVSGIKNGLKALVTSGGSAAVSALKGLAGSIIGINKSKPSIGQIDLKINTNTQMQFESEQTTTGWGSISSFPVAGTTNNNNDVPIYNFPLGVWNLKKSPQIIRNDGIDRTVARNQDLPTPDRKSTRLNSSHSGESRMPSSA